MSAGATDRNRLRHILVNFCGTDGSTTANYNADSCKLALDHTGVNGATDLMSLSIDDINGLTYLDSNTTNMTPLPTIKK